jgi:hypothetical protein
MFLATLALMQAVSARFVARVLLHAPAPVGVPQLAIAQRAGMIHVLFDVIVLAVVCVADMRRRRRVHPAYVIGGAILILVHAFRHMALDTQMWRSTASVVLALTS